MLKEMIIDADLCIKMGGSLKYRYLYDILPLVAEKIYIHTHVHAEVLVPSSAVSQLKDLISDGKAVLVNECDLDIADRIVFEATYKRLSEVMINPRYPNKNKGEACSLAYAKATGIPIFATDEKDLQPIIDKQLNTGMDDIRCVRLVDIVYMAKNKEIPVERKTAKALWVVAGKKKEYFDREIWPV